MTDTSKQWIKDLYEIKDQSELSWSVYFDGEFFTEFADREDAEGYVADQVAHWTRLIAAHAPQPAKPEGEKVDTSKERAEFEKWKQTHFDSSLNPCRWDDECEGYAAPNGGFAPEIQSAFEAWMARAEQSTETPPKRVCPECDGDGCAKCDPIGTIRKVCNGEIQINGGEDEDLDVVLKYIESLLPVAEAPRPVEPQK